MKFVVRAPQGIMNDMLPTVLKAADKARVEKFDDSNSIVTLEGDPQAIEQFRKLCKAQKIDIFEQS